MTESTDPPLIRTSERRDFRRCQQRWWWGWREGLRVPGESANALWFGEGIHIALAEWYSKPGLERGANPVDTWREWVGDEVRRIRTNALGTGNFHEDEFVDAKELGVAMLESYLETYGRDQNVYMLAVERPFQINVPRRDGRGVAATYAGTYDGVYRDLNDDNIKLWEHKTAKAIQTNHLPLDDQAGSYWLVATHTLRDQGVIKPTEELVGITYNFLRKAKPDSRPRNAAGQYLNKDGSVSKVQPSPLFLREEVWRTRAEQRTQAGRIADEAEHMDLMRRKALPLLKNPTKDCSWDCSFFEMCGLHEAGADWQEYRDAVYVQEDPYAAHRKSAAE